MNKKGQGLPLNVLVVAILVIVVLILVLTFFFGGFSSLSQKMQEIFYGGYRGTQLTFAVQNCEKQCITLQARTDPGSTNRPEMFRKSGFCIEARVDLNEDGKITTDEEMVTCPKLGVFCDFPIETGKVQVSCDQ